MVQSRTLVVVAGTLGFVASAFAGNTDLVADAGARLSYQGGGTYGAQGFNIADASGNNRLTIGGAVQTRFNVNVRDDSANDVNGNPIGDGDLTTGFENSLTRLRASGTVGTSQLGYKVQATFSDLSGGFAQIDDAYGTWDFQNGWNLKFGQFNLPVVREIMVGAEDHLGSDFSVTSLFFGQGYSQGIQAGYTGEQFRAMVAFSDGAGTANTTFESDLESDYAFSLRVEGLLMGSNWNQFNTYTSWQSESGDSVLLGGAVHWQDGGETGGTLDSEVLLYTLDATWEGPGYNLTGVFYGNTVEGTGTSQDNFGAMLQGGFFFNDQFEGFARYDGLFLDDTVFTVDNVNFLFAGVNYYVLPETNAAKFTTQLGYALDETAELFANAPGLDGSNNNGFLGQDTDGEWAIQFQFQLVF
jgi:hypothetical protein